MPNNAWHPSTPVFQTSSDTYSKAAPVLTPFGYQARQPAMTAEQFAAYRDNPNSYWGGLGDNRPGAYAARIAGQGLPAAAPAAPTTGGLGRTYWDNIQSLMGAGLGQGMSAAFGQMAAPRPAPSAAFSQGFSPFGGFGGQGYAPMGQISSQMAQMGNWGGGGGMGYGYGGYGAPMPNYRGGWGSGFGYGF